jgi:acyl carrier protein
MEIKEFIEKFAETIEVENVESLTPDTPFRDLEEWSSLTAMGVIAFVKTEYGKEITGKEIKGCTTVEDLYNLVALK